MYTFQSGKQSCHRHFSICNKSCAHCVSFENTLTMNEDQLHEIDIGLYIQGYASSRILHVQSSPWCTLLDNTDQLSWEVYTGVEFSLSK